MSTYTITTAVNIDTLAAKAGSDTYNINGGYLTIDQDTRYGTNQNTSAGLGNIVMSATLGGTVEINSTKVRLIPYNTGTGNVPALGTTISKGGASAILLGVYSALNVTPTNAGSAMPASGYIKVRQWNSTAYTAGALTGIGASATGADTAGWLEIVGVDALTVTVNRLNLFKVRGDWYEIGTTDGTRTTTYQLPTNGGNVYIPGVWVETGSSTNVYEFYPSAGTAQSIASVIATDEVRGRFCWVSTTGIFNFGYDGTNTTGGFIPPAGRRIRVPNIFFVTCTAAAKTVNALPNVTLATRYEFATTGGGVIDIDLASMNWYMNLNQPYSVTLSNTGIMSTLVVTECATAVTWSHVGVGQEAANTQFGLQMSLCFAGGTMDRCTWTRALIAATGNFTKTWTDMSGFTVTNERLHALAARGNANTGAQTLTRVALSSFTNCLLGNGKSLITTCTDLTFTTCSYYDNSSTNTTATNACYAFELSAACARVKMDGLNFGGLSLVQPYSGILSIGAAGCSAIKLRNLGTAASPLDMGGAYVNATWARVTTVMTITKTAHGLAAGDIIAVNIVSDVAPKAVTTSTATLWTVASAPTADTFTVTVASAGAASGTISYYPTMVSTLVVIAASAAANDVKVQRCYTPHLRTGFMSGDNSSKNVVMDNCWGTEWGVQLVPELNCSVRGFQSTPALTAQTSTYGTHWLDHWFAGAPANLAAVAWTRTTTTATVTSTNHGLRTGMVVLVTVTSDAAAIVLGQKTITATTESAFTFTCLNAGGASGTLTFEPLVSRIAIQMNEATTDTTSQVAFDAGTPGFTSAGSLYMPAINDQATFEMPDYLLGHTSFPISEAVMAGGTLANYDVTYAIDKSDGGGYSAFKNLAYSRAGGGGSNASTNVTMTSTTGVAAGDYVFGTNVAPNAKVVSITNGTTIVVNIANIGAVSGTLRFNQMPSEASITSAGFRLKVRIKTTTTNVLAITSLYFNTQTTTTSRAYQYALDPVTVRVTAKSAAALAAIQSARVYLVADTGGPATPGALIMSTVTDVAGLASVVWPYVGNQPVVGRVRKGTSTPLYKTSPIAGTITSTGFDVTSFMVGDE